MRVLYLAPAPLPPPSHPGGARTHIDQVVRELTLRGHEVRLVAGAGALTEVLVRPAAPAVRRLVPRALRNLRREWLERRHDSQFFRRALRAAREFGPDLVYERAALLHLSGARLARALCLPLIVEQNTPQVEERTGLTGLALPGLAARIEHTTYRAADAVVTVSAAMEEYLMSMGVTCPIHVVPNAARVDLFDSAISDGGAVRRRLDLPEAAVVAGFVGTFADWHGLYHLVRAFALAQGGVQADLRLLLVGDGPHRSSVRAMTSQLGIADRAVFPGLVPFERVPDYIAAMDICVVSQATWYGSPIKLFEYGAMGRAVIAPDRGPIREVMADQEEGLIVSPDSLDALAAALTRLANDPVLRQRLGQRFRERVCAQHTWERVADRLEAICAGVLRNTGGSEPLVRGDARGAAAGGS